MIKKTITYIDYDGNSRTEDHYFNLSKAEVAEMQLGTPGGITRMIERLVQEQNGREIVDTFKDLIDRSYGRKSLDGKCFDKDPKWLKEFKQTEAYSQLFMELLSDPDKAAAFFNEVLPKMDNVAAADAAAPVLAPVV